MSYPKFLLQQKIGRELVGDETCDHVDEDFENDDLGNLQVLSRAENASKSASKQSTEWFKFSCPECGKESERELRFVKANWKKGKSGPYCSRSCAGKASRVL